MARLRTGVFDTWPGMAASIHPDWAKAIELSELRRRQEPKNRDGYLWPCIHQEAGRRRC